jgi:hypothetical protein
VHVPAVLRVERLLNPRGVSRRLAPRRKDLEALHVIGGELRREERVGAPRRKGKEQDTRKDDDYRHRGDWCQQPHQCDHANARVLARERFAP